MRYTDAEVTSMADVVWSGRGVLTKLRGMMDALGMRRPLLVAGDRLAATLAEQTGLTLPRFGGFHPNPDFADCASGAAIYRERGCDGLVSIGGGSAMDTAKGVKAMLLAGSAEGALAYAFSGERIPHIAIPATAGTGAEATQFAVVYLQGMKHSLSHAALLPEGIMLDAALLDTLPAYHRKSCALDALCQGIESYWAVGATAESRVHAEAAIRGMLDSVTPYLAGDAAAAEAMLDAAWRSGQAIQVSRTTAAHAMSYRMTLHFGIAHGHACALTLPVLWEQMLPEEAQRPVLAELAGIMGLADPADGPLMLRGLLMALDMEAPAMPETAVLDDLSASVNAERLGNHPQRLTQDQLRDIYVRAFRPATGEERRRCLEVWHAYGRA
ncbi:MAG: iron-containing alcohol dehydrogenase [Aristaeellaceae bacterium]